jgi:hypothetical protein
VLVSGEGLFDSDRELPETWAGEPLELRVARRCTFRLEADTALGADALTLLDGDGQWVQIERRIAGGIVRQTSVPVVDGRTEELIAPDSALVGVLFDGQDELLRFPLTLDSSETNVLRP